MKKSGTASCCLYIGISLIFIGLSFIDHVDSMDVRPMLTAQGFDVGNQLHFNIDTLIDTKDLKF